MIDFNNTTFLKLKPVNNQNYLDWISPMFVEGEMVIGMYQAIRDGIVFTNKRIISINVQGVTGKKKDFTSMPYSKIQAYSVETAGVLDLDSELELWFSGLGKVKFEFVSNCNVAEICRIISGFVLT
ncbi:MAG: PH domain-containing protein [[Eubacterium] saphenum]|nr:PH domain-containing protein [[Eubacterium] saphenum]